MKKPGYSLIFLSSAEISLPLLEVLVKDEQCEVLAVICQPDKPAGRGGKLRAPAPKLKAEELGLRVLQPENLNRDKEVLAELERMAPDFLLTFAYGQILSERVLGLAEKEALNVHASLLPAYRGASPIQAAILNGDGETGISLMRMVKEMDAGPVWSQMRIGLDECVTASGLHDLLAEGAATFVPGELAQIFANEGEFVKQDEEGETGVSYCSKIGRDDGFVDFTQSAEEILRVHRAYSPWPGLWTTWRGKRLKILDLDVDGDGKIQLKKVQLEGKQAMEIDEFILGQPEFCLEELPS